MSEEKFQPTPEQLAAAEKDMAAVGCSVISLVGGLVIALPIGLFWLLGSLSGPYTVERCMKDHGDSVRWELRHHEPEDIEMGLRTFCENKVAQEN